MSEAEEEREPWEVFDSFAGWCCQSCGQSSGWCKTIGHPIYCRIPDVPKSKSLEYVRKTQMTPTEALRQIQTLCDDQVERLAGRKPKEELPKSEREILESIRHILRQVVNSTEVPKFHAPIDSFKYLERDLIEVDGRLYRWEFVESHGKKAYVLVGDDALAEEIRALQRARVDGRR